MKKMLSVLLASTLAFSSAAMAEEAAFHYDDLRRIDFMFSSSAGAWFTQMTIAPDGSFTGSFHDSELGDDGEGYPNGTVYGCLFHGMLGEPDTIDAYTLCLPVTALAPDEGQADEAIEDGIRYVTVEKPYGLEDAEELLLYLPGKPVSELPEGFLSWAHLAEIAPDAEALPFYGLYNEAGECGFVGEPAAPFANMANPWQVTDAQGLMDTLGLRFGIPEGAGDVILQMNTSLQMAEMDLTLNGVQLCARIMPASAFTDISGTYYSWEKLDDFAIGSATGVLQKALDSGTPTQLLLWYDAAPGLMYSLLANSDDLDGFDLTAVAAQVYLPMQGEN